jgi:hypothetical protein
MRTGTLDLTSLSRAALFAVTGVALFVFWFVARPSFEMTAAMKEWPHVLWFSGTLLTLAVSLPIFGRMVDGPRVARLAMIAGAGVGLSSVANVLEDGFRIDAAFFLFISGTLILDLALLALTIEIARRPAARTRVLAVIPAGTLVGILLFVAVGGPAMLVTWLAAAASALWLGPYEARAP